MPFTEVERFFHFTTWEPSSLDSLVGVANATAWEPTHYSRRALDVESARQIELSILLKGIEEVDRLIDQMRPIALPDAVEEQARRVNEIRVNAVEMAKRKAEAQCAKESLFERIRATGFHACPSRLSAMFVCDSEPEIRRTMAKMNFQAQDQSSIIEIAALRHTPPMSEESERFRPDLLGRFSLPQIHRADAVHLNCHSATPEQQESCARQYWSGERTADPVMETLFNGFFRVVRIVQRGR